MSLNSENAAAVVVALGQHLERIAESLNRCFDTQFQLTLGGETTLGPESPDAALDGPGLLVSLAVSGSSLLVAIPGALPLPDWYSVPDESQTIRLETLANELSSSCLPDGMIAARSGTQWVESMWESIQGCRPLAGAVAVPIEVRGSSRRIWCAWPVEQQPDGAFFQDSETAESNAARMGTTSSQDVEHSAPEVPRMLRIVGVPVRVVVQLAHKKIELGQLRELAPGSLVMFDKSCEDLLDLYVNNRLFCRGEAVKVGEKFGLKVNEVGPVEKRISPVINRGNRS